MSNLPIYLSSFVGRDRDLSEVSRLLDSGRVVTLVGPAGCGKTRLATEVVRPFAKAKADGVYFVDLAQLFDAALLALTVAAAMGLTAATPDLDRLTANISNREAVVLLDNAEHLVDDVGDAAEAMVIACPRVRLLITSRESLGVGGEWVYRVGSLAEQAAMRLFVDRARHADARFALTEDNLGTISQICRRLDGIPLALELCAACVGAMTPVRILQRLDERFQLLVGGRRSAVARHRTMRAALEWSDALLSDDERRFFRRLSVFAGDFDMEAAEAVVRGPDLPVAEVMPLLRRLVERSLVLLVRDDAGERYRLLESLRDFGRERLVASGEVEALAEAHARYYTALAHSLTDSRYLSGEGVDPALVEGRLANFRLALEFAADHDSAWLADLAGALAPIWLQMTRIGEGRRWLEAGLAHAAPGSEQRFRLLAGLIDIAAHQNEVGSARSWAEEALRNRRQAGDERGQICALLLLSMAIAMGGNPSGSLDAVQEAIDLARRLDDPDCLARGLNSRAMSLMGCGLNIGEAEQLALEAVDLARRVGPPMRLEFALDTLASAHLRRGRLDAALLAQREALRSPRVSGYHAACGIATMAAVLIALDQPRRAVRLAGAIDRYCELVGLDPAATWDINREWLERGLASLGHQASAVRAAGRRLTIEEAKAYALEEAADDDASAGARLSHREIQVAALVREGLTNRAIAERLFISERTAEGHVTNLLNKLGVNSRAQVAAWVAENAPVVR
ncbi:MAG: LuxR C-terminal-related transcriptional regulator [Candidatus Dormibacteraeota bacterium]|nr:LuxR C-terminal-related transcriptional regulator [Candidatus Dormibacteraeota bacterium]